MVFILPNQCDTNIIVHRVIKISVCKYKLKSWIIIWESISGSISHSCIER